MYIYMYIYVYINIYQFGFNHSVETILDYGAHIAIIYRFYIYSIYVISIMYS